MENAERIESLGPAERIIQTLLTHADHLYHNRPGVVSPDRSSPIGVNWVPVTHKLINGEKVVFEKRKIGRKNKNIRLGVMGEDGKVHNGTTLVGEYRPAGIYPEVAAYLYRQVASVWQMDNEFSARWASYAYTQDHRDMKVVLAAFMLVQSRHGEPIRDGGEIIFHDDDYREVGEAMLLMHQRNGNSMNPKQLLRVFDLLSLPQIVEINRELGFAHSAQNIFFGQRLPKTIKKWLRYREHNVPLFDGLVQGGFRKTVISLAQYVGYKPETPDFFKKLRWGQKQSQDGRRTIALDQKVEAAESWEGLTEREICKKITKDRPSYKRLVGLLPQNIGLTRAIMSAAIDAGSVSDADLIILTPTLEELGLLNHPSVKSKWDTAILNAENQRAANVAQRVRKKETAEKLQEAADTAVKKAVEEAMKDLRVYVMIDKSGSMDGAIDRAKLYLTKFLQGFPLDKLHVSIFNTTGRVINIKHPSAAGVEQAFRGQKADGGTVYASGVKALQAFPPQPNEDVLFIFIGDQADAGHGNFVPTVQASGLRPNAFGLIEVLGTYGSKGVAVEETARRLGIPCFRIEENIFDDPYAVTRTLQHLIKSTPVSQGVVGRTMTRRFSLIETILKTDLLKKPTWAS